MMDILKHAYSCGTRVWLLTAGHCLATMSALVAGSSVDNAP